MFTALGSNLNPILTQLAKTRRAIFVEGNDFQILSRFARKLELRGIANRSDFAVVSVKGFNPERIRSLKGGMEISLGGAISAAALMDKDYRSDRECVAIVTHCETFCDYVTIHRRKEIENFLLVPQAMDRAATRRVEDQARRTGVNKTYTGRAVTFLDNFAREKKSYVSAQYVGERVRFERVNSPRLAQASVAEAALNELEACWNDAQSRLEIIPGKEALSAFNQYLQSEHGVSITPASIVEAMRADEIPEEIRSLLDGISKFARSRVE